MKVKIKKQGKTKEFKLISKWEEVSLSKWLKLIDFHKVQRVKKQKKQ